MRCFFRLVTIALALLAPRNSAASTLEFTFLEPFIVFGPGGAVITASIFESTIDGVFADFSGEAQFVSGPLVSLTVPDNDWVSDYVFGPGTFTINTFTHGLFVAPMTGIQVHMVCEQELAELLDHDCGSPWGDDRSIGEVNASIGGGDGLFDSQLAEYLGIRRPGGLLFDFSFIADGVSGGPSDDLRLSGALQGAIGYEISVTVPEPSVMSLLLMAPLAGLRLRRWSSGGV